MFFSSSEVEKIVLSSLIIIIIFILQYTVQHLFLKLVKISKRVILDDLQTGIVLFLRISAGLIIIYLIVILHDLDIGIIVFISALIGAIITLSSLQILNNIIAGIFIVMLRPYNIQDFIAIGQYEGLVIKFNLNVTKLLTIDNNYVLIQNKNIFKNEVTNFMYYKKKLIDVNERIIHLSEYYPFIKDKKFIQYSFQLSAPFNQYLLIKDKLNLVCDQYENKFQYKPIFFPISLGYKIDLQFVVLTRNSQIFLSNIKNFKKSLIEAIY